MLQSAPILEALEKAIDAQNLTDLVPEDLELEAHNTLWSDTDDTELTALKILPSTPATSVRHEFTQVTSFGYERNSGFFGERALPPETEFQTARRVTPIGLQGELGSTFILAHLQKTQRALGSEGAVNINRAALRLSFLRKKNRNIYMGDTSVHRLGTGGPVARGIEQQIREGTDGTEGESPFGSHVIDMEGEPLVPETIRAKAARSIALFGAFNTLVMDPFCRADFESQLDPAQRLGLPINMRPYMIGQHIGGLQTNGRRISFLTDNVLTPMWYGGKYSDRLITGAPSTTPTVTAAAGAPGGGRESKFDTGFAGAGDVFYIVTEMREQIEGLGTRFPATAGTFLTVGVGQEVELTIQPGDPLSDTLRIYRGYAGQADTEAYWVRDVAVPGNGAAVTVFDGNHDRPGTSRAFGLRITSRGHDALTSGQFKDYAEAKQHARTFFKQPDSPQNTVSVAHLGPQMGIMRLASFLAQVDRALIFSAYSPQVRNPRQNVVFKNIGTINR